MGEVTLVDLAAATRPATGVWRRPDRLALRFEFFLHCTRWIRKQDDDISNDPRRPHTEASVTDSKPPLRRVQMTATQSDLRVLAVFILTISFELRQVEWFGALQTRQDHLAARANYAFIEGPVARFRTQVRLCANQSASCPLAALESCAPSRECRNPCGLGG
jgi:hypothetical protein